MSFATNTKQSILILASGIPCSSTIKIRHHFNYNKSCLLVKYFFHFILQTHTIYYDNLQKIQFLLKTLTSFQRNDLRKRETYPHNLLCMTILIHRINMRNPQLSTPVFRFFKVIHHPWENF